MRHRIGFDSIRSALQWCLCVRLGGGCCCPRLAGSPQRPSGAQWQYTCKAHKRTQTKPRTRTDAHVHMLNGTRTRAHARAHMLSRTHTLRAETERLTVLSCVVSSSSKQRLISSSSVEVMARTMIPICQICSHPSRRLAPGPHGVPRRYRPGLSAFCRTPPSAAQRPTLADANVS